jgi:hypothetical protein
MASDTYTKGIEGLVNELLMWCMVWDLLLMFNPGMVEILWFMVYDYVHSSAACHACAITRLVCYVTALPYLKGLCRGCSQEVLIVSQSFRASSKSRVDSRMLFEDVLQLQQITNASVKRANS